MGGTVPPPKSCVDILTPRTSNMTVFGEGVLKELNGKLNGH